MDTGKNVVLVADKEAESNEEGILPDLSIVPEKIDEKPFPKCDLMLFVEGEELYVNSDILKQASPVFRAMLESDFKEKKQDRIDLQGKSLKAMVEFLKCTFPFINGKITVNNVLLILPLADEYQTDLKERCEDFLINILRGNESHFILRRTDVCENEENWPVQEIIQQPVSHGTFGKVSGFGSSIPVSTGFPFANPDPNPQGNFSFSHVRDETDVECFLQPGYGKERSFDVGNTLPAKRVIEYVTAAEKYGLKRLLHAAIEYVSIRNISYYETEPTFSDISYETRLKMTMLRLRMIEHRFSCNRKADIKELILRK